MVLPYCLATYEGYGDELMIYLDNASTTKQFSEVTEYMVYINENYYANPSSLHTFGYETEKFVEESREVIAGILGAGTDNIIFTSGGTESCNMAIRGYLSANPRKGKHIITTKIEHPAVYEVCRYLNTKKNYDVTWLDVDSSGRINMDQLEKSIRKDTSLICVMLVNNEIGTIQDINSISRIRNIINPEVKIFVDGVQGFGKLKIFPKKSGIDMLSVSSHKIHGPKGVGALYIREGIRINPVFLGGGQEKNLRSGTLNVPGICGFAKAANIIDKDREVNYNKISEIKKYFSGLLRENFDNIIINGSVKEEESSPYVLNVSFPGLKSEVLLHHLADRGIYVSSGSACSSRSKKISHVLEAIGAIKDADSAIRFSFSVFNTKDEILAVINTLKEIVPIITYRGGNQ